MNTETISGMTRDTREDWERRHEILEKSAKSLGYLEHRYVPFSKDSIYGNHYVKDTRYEGILVDEWCPLERSSQCFLLQSTHNISIEILKISEDYIKIKTTIRKNEYITLSVTKASNENSKANDIKELIVEVSALLYDEIN